MFYTLLRLSFWRNTCWLENVLCLHNKWVFVCYGCSSFSQFCFIFFDFEGIFHKIYALILPLPHTQTVSKQKKNSEAQKISRILDFFCLLACLCVIVWYKNNEIFLFVLHLSYDMNDKNIYIFLRISSSFPFCLTFFLFFFFFFPLLCWLFPQRHTIRYKKFIYKMRQRIDGIFAHESSNVKSNLYYKGLAYLPFVECHLRSKRKRKKKVFLWIFPLLILLLPLATKGWINSQILKAATKKENTLKSHLI